MPLFRRPDGDLVKDESPVRSIMPYIMRGRNESVVFHDAIYDITKLRAFLRAFNHEHEREQPATLFHFFLWACAQTLADRPGLNRFISGGRIYRRRGVFVSFSAKKELADEAPLLTVKLEFPKGEPFGDCCKRIVEAIKVGRGDRQSNVDKELALAMMLPGPVLGAVMALLRWLDRVNLMPGWMIEGDPMFTSLFVSNLGSVGLDRTYHHLYEYGTAAMFAAMGMPRKQLMPDRSGNPVLRDVLEVRWTLDERVNDGLYCARTLGQLKKVVEDPAAYVSGASAEILSLPSANGTTP
jgi:2-oxoacid dehydrogenases acyltransferase (catalytic domain)